MSDTLDDILTGAECPTNEYWGTALPTFIENWPQELHSISIPSYGRKLTRDEALVIGHEIVELGEGFDVSHLSESRISEIRSDLVRWLDGKVKLLKGAFIRLGSRSPKDGLYWGCRKTDDKSGRVTDGESAFWRLTACSERVCDDLHMQLAMGHASHVYVRQWLHMPEWCEFRCFQKAGELIGISQYYYRGVYSEITSDAEGLKWAVEQFHRNVFKPAIAPYRQFDNVVFDVFVRRRQSALTSLETRYEVKLLEINPFFNLTDPCLFDWNTDGDFHGQLKYRAELGSRSSANIREV